VLEAESRLIQIDVNVTMDEIIEDYDAMEARPINFRGRGGTNFDMLPGYLLDSQEELPDLLVLFTDGAVDWCDIGLWPCPILVVTTATPIPAPYMSVKLELAS